MSVNKVILVGNLGKDPELRYTPAGVPVATFSMATTERYKDKEGNQQEKTEWHNIVVWRGLAEVCGKFLQKGKQVYIEGKIQTRSYDDRDGNKKYITEIVAENMQMLSRNDGQQRNESNQTASQNSWGSSNNQNQNNNQNYNQGNDQNSGNTFNQNQTQNSNAGGGGFNNPPFNPDDDIPF